MVVAVVGEEVVEGEEVGEEGEGVEGVEVVEEEAVEEKGEEVGEEEGVEGVEVVEAEVEVTAEGDEGASEVFPVPPRPRQGCSKHSTDLHKDTI